MNHIERTKQQIAVMQAYVDGKELEYKLKNFGKECWIRSFNPSWDFEKCDYRIRQTPDTIDWSHVSPKFKWMARDKNGTSYLYDGIPEVEESYWNMGMARRNTQACNFSSYHQGTVDWKESLVERPEGV